MSSSVVYRVLGASLVLLGVLANSGYAQVRRVADSDSVLTLEVPEDWAIADFGNSDASLQMSDPSGRFGVIVIAESKADLFGWNMARFMYVTLGDGVGILDFPEVSEMQHSTIDGEAAVTVSVSGATGGQQFVYLRTNIDAPGHWIQVIILCLRSAWPANEPVLRAIAQSVDILG